MKRRLIILIAAALTMFYEKPTDFCHRHLIAEWLMERTGTRVEEVQF